MSEILASTLSGVDLGEKINAAVLALGGNGTILLSVTKEMANAAALR